MNFLLTRGQQIKVFSMLLRKCRASGLLIPNLAKNRQDEGTYEGATGECVCVWVCVVVKERRPAEPVGGSMPWVLSTVDQCGITCQCSVATPNQSRQRASSRHPNGECQSSNLARKTRAIESDGRHMLTQLAGTAGTTHTMQTIAAHLRRQRPNQSAVVLQPYIQSQCNKAAAGPGRQELSRQMVGTCCSSLQIQLALHTPCRP